MGSISDGSETVLSSGIIIRSFTAGARQQQTVSIAATSFQAITIPTGAKAILIDTAGSSDLKLKGVTGDVGISLDSTCPVLLPLSDDTATMTLGIQNPASSADSVIVYFF